MVPLLVWTEYNLPPSSGSSDWSMKPRWQNPHLALMEESELSRATAGVLSNSETSVASANVILDFPDRHRSILLNFVARLFSRVAFRWLNTGVRGSSIYTPAQRCSLRHWRDQGWSDKGRKNLNLASTRNLITNQQPPYWSHWHDGVREGNNKKYLLFYSIISNKVY